MTKPSEKSDCPNSEGHETPYPALEIMGGQEWSRWFARSAPLMPEFERSLKFLNEIHLLSQSWPGSEPELSKLQKKMLQLTNRFTGYGRCPSVQACEKLAIRVGVLHGWLETWAEKSQEQRSVLVLLLAQVLRRMFEVSEGADDRHGVLIRSLREFSRYWLNQVAQCNLDASDKAILIYEVAIDDRAGLVQQQWWWSALKDTDETALMLRVEQDIETLPEMVPGPTVSWKSYDQRWRRLRIKGLLEHFSNNRLLSELLRRSAVDDFEAAQALKVMFDAGRFREAISQGEKWNRMLPRSPVIAEQLVKVYLHDGWDEEALDLLERQHALDPSPLWTDWLEKVDLPRASSLLKEWRNAAT